MNELKENKYLKLHEVMLDTLLLMDESGDYLPLFVSGEYDVDEAKIRYHELIEAYQHIAQAKHGVNLRLTENQFIHTKARLNFLLGLRALWVLDRDYVRSKLKEEKYTKIKTILDLDVVANNLISKINLYTLQLTKDEKGNDLPQQKEVKYNWVNLIASLHVYQGLDINVKNTSLLLLAQIVQQVHKKTQDARTNNNRRSRVR